MEINEITGQIVDAGMKVHSALGPGLLESAYEACLTFELHRRGLQALRQVELPVIYEGVRIDVGYRIGLLVQERIVVEVKSVDEIHPIHKAQLLTYLKLSNLKIGLLLNFNTMHFKNGITRLAN